MIKDLRSDSLPNSYRRRIRSISELADLSQLDTRIGELSNEFERVISEIVKEHFDTMSLGKSAAMFLLGLVPGLGDFIGGADLLKEVASKLSARRSKGWVGFSREGTHQARNLTKPNVAKRLPGLSVSTSFRLSGVPPNGLSLIGKVFFFQQS